MKKLFYTLVVLIFSTLVTFGQGRSVKGKVTDVNAKPLEGVTVRVQGKATCPFIIFCRDGIPKSKSRIRSSS
jgi:hypothetical protein